MTIQFATSGTTGRPKPFSLTPEQRRVRADHAGVTSGTGFAELTSLFVARSVNSSSFQRYADWIQGRGTIYGPQPSLPRDVEIIKQNDVQGIIGSPSFLIELGKHLDGYQFRYVKIGGSSCSPEQASAVRVLGDNVWSNYSVSEVGRISLASVAQIEAHRGCVGELVDGVEVRFDRSGQILAKTRTMIFGYDDPDLTAKYFQDGWFATGDCGVMKDNLLIVTGRVS